MPVSERTLEYYTALNGKAPFREWLNSLNDRKAQQIIDARLIRLQCGLFGDCVAVGEGVFELRIHVPAGLRVYFAPKGRRIVLLLCGGIKSTQRRDIAKAKAYWADHKARSS